MNSRTDSKSLKSTWHVITVSFLYCKEEESSSFEENSLGTAYFLSFEAAADSFDWFRDKMKTIAPF